MAVRFSNTMLSLKPSDIGPLLAIIAQPDIISFAGGLPAPQTFPLKELTEVAVKMVQVPCSMVRPWDIWDFGKLLLTV